MHVLLDLWGTVLDGARMNRAYARRLAEILAPRFGGEPLTWILAHDDALAWYTAKANVIDWSEGDYLEKVDALDAEPAIQGLRKAGHRVHVVTSATDSNARGALTGAGLLDHVDGVFTGNSVGLHKSTVAYWHRVVETMAAPGGPVLVVDDRLDFLRPAVTAGLTALLIDRPGSHPHEGPPSFVRAILRSLAGLPHLADLYSAGKGP